MFQNFYGQFLTTLNAFMDSKYQAFIDTFRPLAIIILTLYIMIVSVLLLTGKTEKSREIFITILLSSFITTIVFSYGVYKEWILDTVLQQTFRFQGFFLTIDGSGLPSQVFLNMDKTFELMFGKLEELEEEAGFFSARGWAIATMTIGLKLIYGVLYLVFAVLIIFSTFALFVFFVIGGIPLYFAIMPQTRFIFWSWLRAILNYVLIPVFTSIVMAISLKFLGAVVDDLFAMDIEKNGIWNMAVANAFFIGCLAIFFHLKAPEFAAALTGGQPSGIGGFFTTMAGLGASTYAVGKFGTSKAWGTAKGLYNSPKNAITAYNEVKNVSSSIAETAIRAKNAFSKSKGL
ncbi:type IV secretion system protein [Aliarcobacter thereius]|uniref:type IV secretion system protein n=1 Tax=Aliarcobacter thereius TaxID=544718 RepID=UPI000828CA51|nr:type IV secretion system protein [Aliarcobacter thereius]OCL90596.1 TrbL/VirB6 plasmid conjugal transfer protein [Aliarcobacter thereius]